MPALPAIIANRRRERREGCSLNQVNRPEVLEARVRELEDKLSRLRLSRRVLMNLLLAQEEFRQDEINRLRAENERLRRLGRIVEPG